MEQAAALRDQSQVSVLDTPGKAAWQELGAVLVIQAVDTLHSGHAAHTSAHARWGVKCALKSHHDSLAWLLTANNMRAA
jgi:hypothetical protein